ncbi:MAG TPA: 7-cyano-7-deazaguanine synthase [Lacipirellulaceae bacterium]
MPGSFQSTTGLLLSGGIDSAVLLDQLLQRGSRVVPFYVETGCAWTACELNAVHQLLDAAAAIHCQLDDLVLLEMPLADLYVDHWSISGENVPDDTTADEAVFMPGHNPLLLLKPALWCQMHGIGQLALATLANNPFEDATPEFFAAFENMLGRAASERVHIVRPFAHLTKHSVLQLGRHLPLERTFSCLSPDGGLHCGRCNKCAERRLAFHQIGRDDPTSYAASSSRHWSGSPASYAARR